MVEEAGRSSLEDPRKAAEMVPTGSMPLSEERMRLIAPQWETIYGGLRQMDDANLGEIEPSTIFVWRSEAR